MARSRMQRLTAFLIAFHLSFFFLSLTGQACLTHVETPRRGNSHACTKNHAARIKEIKGRKVVVESRLLDG